MHIIEEYLKHAADDNNEANSEREECKQEHFFDYGILFQFLRVRLLFFVSFILH